MIHYFNSILFTTAVILLAHCPVEAKLKKQHIQELIRLHQENKATFLCQQPFDSQGYLQSTSSHPYFDVPLSIQWMPIIPINKLASHLPCYHNKLCIDNQGRTFKGIRCCEKTNPYFTQMQNDYFNYVPENPTLIKSRKNRELSKIVSDPSDACRIHFDKHTNEYTPNHEIRGFIARTYLYFNLQYQLPLSAEELSLFHHWDQQYPISHWERKRALEISQLQRVAHPFIFTF